MNGHKGIKVRVSVFVQLCLRWMKSAQAFQCYGQSWLSIESNKESGRLNPAILETPACLKIQSASNYRCAARTVLITMYFSLRAAILFLFFVFFYYET